MSALSPSSPMWVPSQGQHNHQQQQPYQQQQLGQQQDQGNNYPGTHTYNQRIHTTDQPAINQNTTTSTPSTMPVSSNDAQSNPPRERKFRNNNKQSRQYARRGPSESSNNYPSPVYQNNNSLPLPTSPAPPQSFDNPPTSTTTSTTTTTTTTSTENTAGPQNFNATNGRYGRNDNRGRNNRPNRNERVKNNNYAPKYTPPPTENAALPQSRPTLSPFAAEFIPSSAPPPSSSPAVPSPPPLHDGSSSDANSHPINSGSSSRHNQRQFPSRRGPKYPPRHTNSPSTITHTATVHPPPSDIPLTNETPSPSPYPPSQSHENPASSSRHPQTHYPSKGKYVNSTAGLRKESRKVENADDIPASIGDHTLLASKIIVKLNQNAYECMVCYDNIGRKADVWWCANCYALFHFKCIDEWASRSNNENKKADWRCPGCQHVCNRKPECTCFCGKVRNPDYNPYFLPHSCGENCRKARGVGCPHPCPLLCHPGPCPPCTIPGKFTDCFCGKETYRLKCGEVDKGTSCGKPCDTLLNCGKHECEAECHAGPCSNCKIMEEQRCYCGARTQRSLCGTGVKDFSQGEERVYSCGDVCNRTLACGNHKCTQICHTGPCEECELLPRKVTTCPCGSTPLSLTRKSCLDPIPTCSNTCKKMLPCGLHHCPETCHTGPCAPCATEILVRCRCRATTAKLPCHKVQEGDPLLCSAVCNKKKSCGHHTCGMQCCASALDSTDAAGNHVCMLICDKPLKCGSHNCPELCHRGSCPKCSYVSFDELPCACGKTVTLPPVVCGTRPPRCTHPCTKSRPCGHVDVIPHNCHFGDCHPCVALVERMCVGGHVIRKNVRCSQEEVSCGMPCGKKLQCGNHTCTRVCHSGPCFEEPPPSSSSSSQTKGKGKPNQSRKGKLPSCGNLCLAKLGTCEHLCQAVCHPGKACPQVLCKQMAKVKCSCGRRTGEMICNRSGDGVVSGNEAKPLPCDDVCEVETRNRKLADALGISSTGERGPQYSDLLINLVKASPLFVKKIEQSFEELLTSSPSTSTLNLPVMDRVKRQLVHELSKYYRLETHSIDKEPVRSVVVTRTRESRIPSVKLSEVVAPARFGPAQSHTPQPSLRGPGVLLIYNLQSYVKTNHLVAFLQAYAGKYRLQWVDDANCLAIFNDELDMRIALSTLSGGMFSIKVYKDLDTQEFHMTPLSQPKERKVVAPKAAPAKPEPWVLKRTDNAFASLSGSTDVDVPLPRPRSTSPPHKPAPSLSAPPSSSSALAPPLLPSATAESWEDMAEETPITTTTSTSAPLLPPSSNPENPDSPSHSAPPPEEAAK